MREHTSRPRSARVTRAEGARRDHHHEAPDVMWGTDMTATVTVAEGPAFVFVAVDHCTADIGMPPSAGSRPWSRSARASANASGASAKAWPVGCGRHARVELLGRRFSTGGRVLRESSPSFVRERRQRRRGALHPHAEGESVVGAELRDPTPPGLACVQAAQFSGIRIGRRARTENPASNQPEQQNGGDIDEVSGRHGLRRRQEKPDACADVVQ